MGKIILTGAWTHSLGISGNAHLLWSFCTTNSTIKIMVWKSSSKENCSAVDRCEQNEKKRMPLNLDSSLLWFASSVYSGTLFLVYYTWHPLSIFHYLGILCAKYLTDICFDRIGRQNELK